MLPTIAQHAKSFGLEPLKKLGQNFLFDLSLCEKIARCSPYISGNIVVEIGPGPGGLTRAILNAKPKHLIVIERDKRCVALLNEIKLSYPNLHIIEGDALKVKISDLYKYLYDVTSEEVKEYRWQIISNLPYNITTPLIINWFSEIDLISCITIMVQKEVADRICASKGNKIYGRLSVICQVLCNTIKQFEVSPSAFYPPPKVYSSVINLIPHKTIINKEEIKRLELLTHYAFCMRRKMLKSSLKSAIFDPQEFLHNVGIDPSLRAEDLSPAQFLTMARALLLHNEDRKCQ